jgi:spectinomycin phosphotransferase
VLEPLAIPDGDIVERLRTRFGVDADAVEFLPLGYDADAWVYRIHARDGDRFLKIRRGPVDEAGLAIPRLLASRGIRHLVAPVPTVTGTLFDPGELAFVLFPFIEGRTGGEGMTAPQWSELGRTMWAIHDQPVDAELASILRTEDFVPLRIGKLRDVEAAIAASDHAGDTSRIELAGIWRSHQDRIDRLVVRTEALAPLARQRAGPMAICHADIHAWNVVVTPEDDIVIVDWDGAMLAPRERDLMFVDGVAGGHEADPAAFFAGYGDVEVDPEVMAYYRVEWTVQDLAEFGAQVFLDPDAGDATKAEGVASVTSILDRLEDDGP